MVVIFLLLGGVDHEEEKRLSVIEEVPVFLIKNLIRTLDPPGQQGAG